jgi:hypothetical protein
MRLTASSWGESGQTANRARNVLAGQKLATAVTNDDTVKRGPLHQQSGEFRDLGGTTTFVDVSGRWSLHLPSSSDGRISRECRFAVEVCVLPCEPRQALLVHRRDNESVDEDRLLLETK